MDKSLRCAVPEIGHNLASFFFSSSYSFYYYYYFHFSFLFPIYITFYFLSIQINSRSFEIDLLCITALIALKRREYSMILRNLMPKIYPMVQLLPENTMKMKTWSLNLTQQQKKVFCANLILVCYYGHFLHILLKNLTGIICVCKNYITILIL